MLGVVVPSVVLAIAAGYLVKWLLDKSNHTLEITQREFVVGGIVAILVLGPLTGWVGWRISRTNLVTFNEYWNGWELDAKSQRIRCTRDGPCWYEYDCDPYTVTVSYSCGTADKPKTCTRPETRYHSCPYVTFETHYRIQTTLGSVAIAENRFPENPQEHRWRPRKRIPQHVINRAGEGIPSFWLEAKHRVESGNPGPVSARRQYENYLLASDNTILKQYSADVADLKEKGLLPPIQASVHSFYRADKAYFVGLDLANKLRWHSVVSRFNAAFGGELQGDLHLVLVASNAVQNPDAYALALKTHWLDREQFGKNALPKNVLVVIAGTDGNYITWARAFTGMPQGNEALKAAISSKLEGVEFTPEALIGNVRGEFYRKGEDGFMRKKVRSVAQNGALYTLVWGVEDPNTKFARVSMSGDDEDDVGSGYLYLRGEIQPTIGQRIVIGVATFFVCSLVWLAGALIGRRRGSLSSHYHRW